MVTLATLGAVLALVGGLLPSWQGVSGRPGRACRAERCRPSAETAAPGAGTPTAGRAWNPASAWSLAAARRAFGAGMVVFVLASAACGLAPTSSALVAAWLVQGSAAAALMPASMALVSQAYPDPARRARALGLWALGGAAASTAGPLLGGVLTEVSRRLIFFVNVPAGAGAGALVLLDGAARSPRHSVPFDGAGQVAAIAATSGLTYGASRPALPGSPRPACWRRSRSPRSP